MKKFIYNLKTESLVIPLFVFVLLSSSYIGYRLDLQYPLKVQEVYAQLSPTYVTGGLTGVCSSATANCATAGAGGSVEISTNNYATTLVTIHGTYAGDTVFFEGTDDSLLWYADACTLIGTPATIENTKALSDNTAYAYRCPVSGFVRFRVRLSATTSGTAVVGLTTSYAARP